MPGPEVVGVVALLRVARGGAEVAKVARGARRKVLVVAHARLRARLEASPGGVVAPLELEARPGVVDVVTEDRDRAVDVLEKGGRCLVAGTPAGGDVPRADEDRVAGHLPRGA